ncbi:hypothetical protein CK203_028090 [Vitis vinifera]|uniref:Uncharacterized protein n=1 Tax=Vitis vinifera TaxID=29760 RepID=A0A438ILW6_VITVI|nr:hypothetical protein CK203_028090 [Vitis vinifera]
MRSKLERVEADLAADQKAIADGTEMLKLAKRKKEAIRAKASLEAQKKETEELQAGLLAQKKELEARFAAQKELETEYQRQVDEMYFFGYRCCMKKNGIMHDIHSLHSDDGDAIAGGPPR